MFRSWTSWYGSTAPAGVKSEELILVERWGTQKISENPFGCEFWMKICFFRCLIVNICFANLGRLLYSPLYFFLKISSLSWAAVHPEMYRTARQLSNCQKQVCRIHFEAQTFYSCFVIADQIWSLFLHFWSIYRPGIWLEEASMRLRTLIWGTAYCVLDLDYLLPWYKAWQFGGARKRAAILQKPCAVC